MQAQKHAGTAQVGMQGLQQILWESEWAVFMALCIQNT